MKLLLSWYAHANDFVKLEGEAPTVNPDGPTLQFHRHFYETGKYDKHLLLSTANPDREDLLLVRLLAELRRQFPKRVIESRQLGIDDPIDLPVIKSKVETLLLAHRDDDVTVFFSPGTSAMQVAWYACATTLVQPIRLVQTRAPRFTSTRQPALLQISVQTSPVPVSAIVAEQQVGKTGQTDEEADYLITPALQPVYEKAKLVASTDKVTCLIRGEHGTGKEHLAQFIHRHSPRAGKPFVVINCSALGDTLLESRLFGHKKGAFTGADRDQKGLFEEATGGTLFLDEIGDVSPYLQQSLLRALQQGEILPVGATKPVRVDVRVLAATNRNLEEMGRAGTFRWDLYYRLAVVELALPTLVERGEAEVQALVEHFAKRLRTEFQRPKPLVIQHEALRMLVTYPYPGNVRELENVIRSLYVFCTDGQVRPADLPPKLKRAGGGAQGTSGFNWKTVERDLIEQALRFFGGNKRRTWQALGYGSLNTLRKKIDEYGIDVPKSGA